jgi:hypothetical protein
MFILPPANALRRFASASYISHFQALGLHGVGSKTVALDSPPFLASAVKPGR